MVERSRGCVSIFLTLIIILILGAVEGYSVYQHDIENREGIICLNLGITWDGVEEYEERWGELLDKPYVYVSKITESEELRTIRIYLEDPDGNTVDIIHPRIIHDVTCEPPGCISKGYLELLELADETTSGYWKVVWEDDRKEVFSEVFLVKDTGKIFTMVVQFPWSNDTCVVDYAPRFETFLYTTGYNLDIQSWREVGSSVFRLIKYFEEELWYGKDTVILDPEPPSGENNTFVDLFYNRTLMMDLENHICNSLDKKNIIGFVLGDEWPRGLNREEITVDKLAKYNQTYHDETGHWMRQEPSLEEKKTLANWFYNHSIDAWNRLATRLRQKYPDMRIGTNIDLVWGPDYTISNVAHWKSSDWWREVDLEPYDFVVTHYLTKMKLDPRQIGVNKVSDEAPIARLKSGLESLLDPADNITRGLDVFLMLGAHCQYPYIITPMQMVYEWNIALEFREHLAGVGWFTFDIWGTPDSIWAKSITTYDNYAPLKENRLLTIGWLGSISKYGKCEGEVPETIPLHLLFLHLSSLMAIGSKKGWEKNLGDN